LICTMLPDSGMSEKEIVLSAAQNQNHSGWGSTAVPLAKVISFDNEKVYRLLGCHFSVGVKIKESSCQLMVPSMTGETVNASSTESLSKIEASANVIIIGISCITAA